MKSNIKSFIIVVAAIICTATAQAQLGSLKKLTEKKEPKQKTEAPADASAGNAEAAKPTATQQKSSQSGAKAGELDFSAGTPQFSYLSLFREIELEEKTGRFIINGMSVIIIMVTNCIWWLQRQTKMARHKKKLEEVLVRPASGTMWRCYPLVMALCN